MDKSQDEMNAEANEFAMCLLMPEEFVRAEVAKLGSIDLTDDEAVTKLAKKFKVPVTAMALRLGALYHEGKLF